MNSLTVFIDQLFQGAWTQSVGWALLHSLWQITLIAALYAVAAVALRKRSASLRYIVGCVAMAGMLIVPMATFFVLPSPLGLPEPIEIEILVGPTRTGNPDESPLFADALGEAATSPPITNSLGDPDFTSNASDLIYGEQPSLLERVTQFVQPWLPTATVAWLFGVLLLSLRPVLGCLRVQTLRSNGLTPLAESHCQLAQQLVDRLGIGHVVQFAQSALVEVPTVIGYLRPIVLLPVSSVTGLTTVELELILAHELAHIRRHDYAVNLIQTVIEALLFYHPAMWWVSSHVRHERENCCDDVAVATSGDRATYIRALAQLEEHRVAPPALSATGGSLLMRVRRLLDQPQSEFGYRKSSVWLTALILGVSVTVAAFAGSLSERASDTHGTELAELTPAQSLEIAEWAEQVHNGKMTQENFASRLKAIGPESVRALIPLMADGETDQVAMNAFTPFLDQSKVQLYLESVLDELPALLHRPANVSHCCLTLLGKYPENLETTSREADNVARCVKFLKVNPYAAISTLGAIGGKNAYDELIAAFETMPMDRWTNIANSLEQIGNPSAIPELQHRLRDDELPLGYVRSFTSAIYSLSGGSKTNSSFQQGVRFKYPYARNTKSFTVSDVRSHFISLPKVDASTEDDRSKIWKAFSDKTPGPGFTIDGNEIVLFHGLRALPFTSDNPQAVENRDKWICETPAEEFITRFNQPGTTDRVLIPADGLLLTIDPEQTLHLLKLTKTTEDFEYNVNFLRRLPLKSPSVNDDVSGELNFEEQVGQAVAQAIRQAELPFIDETKLADIEADFARFMSSKIPFGTYKLGSSIPAEQRKAILSAIEQHGAQHLGIDRYRPSDLRSINGAYLGLPDRLLTLKWKLYQAIIHARALEADKQARLEAQRSWMKEHIRSLTDYGFTTHQTALSALEERLADPLCCTLGYPMTDEQFRLFRGELQKYVSQKRELGHVTTHIMQQSLNSKYRDFGDFQLPFNDRVVGYGAGRFVHLSFESNRPFESSTKAIADIESSGTVIDATTGDLVTAPKKLRENKEFESWINGQSKGDFGFDDANGGSLSTTRGAKLVKLDVRTWVEADAIGNDELKALLNGSAAKRTVSLRKYNLNNQPNKNAPYCYVGVLTKEGRIAVVAVESFSGSGPLVRSRVRSTVPSMKSAELSDEEVTITFNRPAHWLVNRDFPKSTEPTCSFRQPDSEVRRTLATMKVRFENNGVPTRQNVISEPNPKATVHKTLTIAGEPARITAYPIPSTSGELMTVAFGKGTRSYTLTFVYPTSQRQQYVELALAVSKSIRIRATEGEAVIEDPKNPEWGDPSDGVQLRIHSPEVQQDRGKWKVQLKTDIRANKERVLPNYGAPIDAYVIQWNGKWYRPANDNANLAANMKPSNATQRDSMPTVINAAGWIEESTGKPMSALSPGQHKLRIALPLHDGPKDKAEKPQRAVSNEIEVEIVAVQPDHTLRIGGKHAQGGTVFGKVEGNVGSYSVTLEHELWKNKLGALPNIVVKSGETFEFTNVPVGECTVAANPVLVINDIKRERTHLSKTVEVKDGQTASADLVSGEIEVEAKKRLIGMWVGGGALMPVHHTFDADGSYEKRIADDLPEKGTWRLENDRLIRQIETQESTSKQIKWIDPNFFRVIDKNGKTSGYHRVDETTGKVILTEATRNVKVIDAASESQPHSLASDKPSEGSIESAVSKPPWHSSYRQHARQLAGDAKKYLSNDRTGHIIDFALFSILPDGYEPDLKIEVTGNGTPTKIDPDTVPPKNATAHETFTVGGNVARLTVRRLPADAGKPAIAEEATIEMIYGTKSIELTLDFPIAARDYYLALFKAFAQSLKPTNTKNDSAASPPAELSARETVTQFLKQLAEGKKKSNGKRGSWDHAKAYTTSGDAWTEIAGINKWSDELVKLAENQAFRPIASLGTAERMMVLASTTREKIATDEAPKVGLFDLVKKDDRWLIEKMAIHQNEAAWHTVDGFTRNDDVRWEVTRADVIGEFHFNMLTCKGPVTLAEDGTWKAYLSSKRMITGTWRLEGDVLVRESIGEYTGKLITRSRIVGFFNGGFTAKNLKSEGDKVINEDLGGSVYYRTPIPPILGEDKPAQEGDADVVQPISDKQNTTTAKNGEKPLNKEVALPGQIESGWKSVTIDDWQELFEFRVNKNQSVFGTKTFKSDANLAIGTFLDIGTVANEHGFTHLRVIQTTPAKQFPRLNIAIQAAEKGIGEMFVVEFYAKKPADSDDVMEVASLVKIAGPDRFEKKKKSHELSEKMKARYGNRYAVYEMHPSDLRKGKRIHLGVYLTKGKVKKPLGSTSLGPESYRDHSRLAVAIVDGKAVIERWGSEGYTGNAWDLKDDLNKECQALNSETDWPGFRVETLKTKVRLKKSPATTMAGN